MTSGKFLLSCLFCLAVVSCQPDHTDRPDPIIQQGLFLIFRNTSSEKVCAYNNSSYLYEPDSCPGLLVVVSSADTSYPPPVKAGDQSIEKQIKGYLELMQGQKYNGDIPIIIDYKTDVCKSITLTLYDKDDNFLAEVTDYARFFDVREEPEIGAYYLFNSQKEFIGRIEQGMSIKGYLAYEPLLFPVAHFLFPEYGDKEMLSNGNYILVQIELGDGTILTSKSTTDVG